MSDLYAAAVWWVIICAVVIVAWAALDDANRKRRAKRDKALRAAIDRHPAGKARGDR